MSYTNIFNGDLWHQIKKHKEFLSKNNIVSWDPQTFSDYPNVTVDFANHDWLTNVVGKTRLMDMKDGECLFLAAQTGTGKTTLLFKHCLPIANMRKRKVLFLSSRIALCNKIKRDAMKDVLNGEISIGRRKVKDLKNYLSDEGLDEHYEFGLLDVLTYQHFLSMLDYLDPAKYDLVFLDEVHFFTSDATYNSMTEEILFRIIEKFKCCKRIYSTATPQDCLEPIYEAEMEYHLNNPKMINRHDFPIVVMDNDYSYLNPIFFTDSKEIVREVSKYPNIPWLIYVRNKSIGEALQKELTDKNFSVEMFTADSDKNDSTYQDMLGKEKLSKRVFITTRVLDVGINIKNHFNIVIFEDDIVEVMQMLGRKRIYVGEKVSAYFYAPALPEMRMSYNILNNKLNNAQKRVEAIENNEYAESIDYPLYIKGNTVGYNRLFFKKVKSDLLHYDKLIEQMSAYGRITGQRRVYALWLLSHFENVSYDEKHLFLTDVDDEILKILSSNADKTLNKEEFKDIANELKDLYGDPRVKGRDTAPGISTVNEMVNQYKYAVRSEGSPVTYTIYKEEAAYVQ